MSTKKLQILGQLGDKIYKQNDEPTDAEDGALWIDLDEEAAAGSNIDLSGYAQKTDLPTKTSDLVNDSGYLTTVPVESVNGQTGAVVLDAAAVGADVAGSADSALTEAKAYVDDKLPGQIVTTISSNSTDDQYPTAKAVYSVISSVMGEYINEIDTLIGGDS